MKSADIKRLAKKIRIKSSAVNHDRILTDAEAVLLKSTKNGSKVSRPDLSIWRIIMKSKITKLAAAAVIIIAVMIGVNQFGGSIDLSTIAFAEISEAMKKVPWMHMANRGFDEKIEGPVELLIGFEAKIAVSKDSKGKITLLNIGEHKSYEYDPENRSITIDYAYEDDFPLNLSSPVSLLESMHKMLKEQGAQIITRETKYNGQRAQVQEISLSSVGQNNESHILRLYIQPDSKLLFAAQVEGTDSNGNIIMDGEITFSYPQTGPADIYDLGVPHDAEIISKLPKEDYQTIWDNYRQSRDKATKEYIAVITHANQSLGDIITMIDVDYKSNQNHRLERHSVFNTGEQLDKFWPKYKEQLGDSFNSLLAWTNIHYNNTGHISVYLYDGQYDYSTARDDKGNWGKLRKSYSPNSNHMPIIYLERLGWPHIYKTGNIIEDDYAKENNLICIERLQQGLVHSGDVSPPGRFLYYLDPQKDYICRRKVTEWRPDAQWQEDKNWLNGVEPEKIRDGSIVVEDITEVIQTADGHWYPKVIVVKQSGTSKDYKEAPLRITTIKSIYLRSSGKFPDGIFDQENLPK